MSDLTSLAQSRPRRTPRKPLSLDSSTSEKSKRKNRCMDRRRVLGLLHEVGTGRSSPSLLSRLLSDAEDAQCFLATSARMRKEIVGERNRETLDLGRHAVLAGGERRALSNALHPGLKPIEEWVRIAERATAAARESAQKSGSVPSPAPTSASGTSKSSEVSLSRARGREATRQPVDPSLALPLALRIIAESERGLDDEDEDCEKVDYKQIYECMADWMSGNIAPKLNAASSAKLVEVFTRLMHDVKANGPNEAGRTALATFVNRHLMAQDNNVTDSINVTEINVDVFGLQKS